jgi:hypothetical protein
MLAKPLTKNQIEAAVKFWKDGNWEVTEFAHLKQCFPGPQEAFTLKAVAVNMLYGAGVRPIARVAEYLKKRLDSACPTGPELVRDFVNEIANLKLTKRNNHYHVFVSKFAHFFINPDLPILDQYSEWMVEQHLGKEALLYDSDRYLRFDKNIRKLKEEARLTCDWDELDHYLWIAGEYRCWLRKLVPGERIDQDLLADFNRLKDNPETERTLAELLGIAARSAIA